MLPYDALHRWKLARFALAEHRLGAASTHLTAALRRRPLTAEMWLDRAQVALLGGRLEAARRAVRRGAALAPIDVEVCQRAALLLLQAEAVSDAFPAFRCILDHGPERSDGTLDLALAVLGDPRPVLEAVVGADAARVRLFLEWAYRRKHREASRLGWDALGRDHDPSVGDHLGHVDFLLSVGDVEEANAIWTAVYGPRGPSLVYDGGFEGNAVGRGFGWRFGVVDGARVAVQRGASAAREAHGLAIEFMGQNVGFHHVSQIVPVAAERRYRLSALVAADGITSLGGPFLRVAPHESCPGMAIVDGREFRGTVPWQPTGLEFVTPADCRAIVVQVLRPASVRLDRDIRGRLYLDDVTLRDLGPAPPPA